MEDPLGEAEHCPHAKYEQPLNGKLKDTFNTGDVSRWCAKCGGVYVEGYGWRLPWRMYPDRNDYAIGAQNRREWRSVKRMRVVNKILDFDGAYQVSSDGLIRFAKPAANRQPGRYKQIQLKPKPKGGREDWGTILVDKHGRPQNLLVANIVAQAFLGLRPKNKEIDHVNGDPLDNRVENLEYVTPKENSRRAIRRITEEERRKRHGTLSEDQVREIRKLHAGGMPPKKIEKKTGVDSGVIYHIVNGKTYKWVK